MMAFCIVICFYGVLPYAAQLFTYMNRNFVFFVNRQQYLSHAVLLCELQPEAEYL